jgi:hypothetical protein
LTRYGSERGAAAAALVASSRSGPAPGYLALAACFPPVACASQGCYAGLASRAPVRGAHAFHVLVRVLGFLVVLAHDSSIVEGIDEQFGDLEPLPSNFGVMGVVLYCTVAADFVALVSNLQSKGYGCQMRSDDGMTEEVEVVLEVPAIVRES